MNRQDAFERVIDSLNRAMLDEALWLPTLARSMTIRDIMAATGRSESTIRWHLKHIYAKHGLSRQAELVQLVMLVAGSPGALR